MDYVHINIPVTDQQQAEIAMAMLSDLPFESFETGDDFLNAYIPSDDFGGNETEIKEIIAGMGLTADFQLIRQQNWNAMWEANFEPVVVPDKVVVRAPFHPQENELPEIVIMPKMSFGTGHHATTALMLELIFDMDFTGLAGLDMGSGTGVLAIAAIMQGARSVDAVDVDQWAFENSKENIQTNGCCGKITPILGDISSVTGNCYDFVLANINRNIITGQLPEYAAMLPEGGTLLVSGILEEDVPVITASSSRSGFRESETKLAKGWAALKLIKE